MNRCLVCDKNMEDSFINLFDNHYKVCYECLSKFKARNDKFIINGCEGLVLYYYNEFFKEVLFKYKGVGDYLLKDVFFVCNLEKLKKKYKNYKIVLAPSNNEDEERRGFCHLEEVFKLFDLEIIKCFKKNVKWKQSDKKLVERENIQNVIKIDKMALKGAKKVLIVDDVLTSGSTIRAMISQIPANISKKVLVLSSNCRILRNEIV